VARLVNLLWCIDDEDSYEGTEEAEDADDVVTTDGKNGDDVGGLGSDEGNDESTCW
jgi:hypothetical protein